MASKIIENWKLVTAIDNYEEVAGKILFEKIFTIAPSVYPIFKFSKNHEINSDSLFADKSFKRHAAGVIRTVDVAVGMLGPDLAPLLGILKELGRKHRNYRVKAEYYDVVGQALIETLAAATGDAFTDEVKAAWTELYGVISSTMIEGAQYDVEVVHDDDGNDNDNDKDNETTSGSWSLKYLKAPWVLTTGLSIIFAILASLPYWQDQAKNVKVE